MLKRMMNITFELKKGGFYILILIGTIAMILAALIILSESSLKKLRNNVNVRLGKLFDLLKGSVSRNFRPPVFFMIRTHLGP